MAPILELKSLCKKYGTLDILRDVNVSIEAGEFLVLVGPSGCGKSTLLNCIAGLEPISGGVVMIDGHDMQGISPKIEISPWFSVICAVSNDDCCQEHNFWDEGTRCR